MSTAFTFEQREQIPVDLINAGMAIAEEVGLKKMTVAAVAKKAGVATGTFYSFFRSKENFVVAMFKQAEVDNIKLIAANHIENRKMHLNEFFRVYRECFRPDNNFLLRLRAEDRMWYQDHISDDLSFSNKVELQRLDTVLLGVDGVRKDIDKGVVINFIKAIYSMYQNRATFFGYALETNVDMIFEALYNYMAAVDKK